MYLEYVTWNFKERIELKVKPSILNFQGLYTTYFNQYKKFYLIGKKGRKIVLL